MKGMVSREVKRVKLIKACGDNHDFTDKPIRDPVDRRRILKPQQHQKLFDGLYDMVVCRNCGTFKAVPSKDEGLDASIKERERREYFLCQITDWAFDRYSADEFEEFRQTLMELLKDAGRDRWPYEFCPSCDMIVEVEGIPAVCISCGAYID